VPSFFLFFFSGLSKVWSSPTPMLFPSSTVSFCYHLHLHYWYNSFPPSPSYTFTTAYAFILHEAGLFGIYFGRRRVEPPFFSSSWLDPPLSRPPFLRSYFFHRPLESHVHPLSILCCPTSFIMDNNAILPFPPPPTFLRPRHWAGLLAVHVIFAPTP